MKKFIIEPIIQSLECFRLRIHFKNIETILRERDITYLPPHLQNKRSFYLNQLQAYAEHGRFPRNESEIGYTPCFVDENGRECAVAHLLMLSGDFELSNKISITANYSYLADMSFPELDEWISNCGLTKEELGLIQPGYYLTFSGALLCFSFALWGAGVFIALTNMNQLMLKRYEIIKPIVGFILASILIFMGGYCLFFAYDAYLLSFHADVPSLISSQAFDAVNPLLFGGLISSILSFIISWLSFHNVRKYINIRYKRKNVVE